MRSPRDESSASSDRSRRASERKATEESREITDGVSDSERGPGEGDRGFANCLLRHSVAQSGRCNIDNDGPSIAATAIVAALQFSRSFDQTCSGACIFRLLTAGNVQIAGWRQGKQLGSASFLSAAVCLNGMEGCKPRSPDRSFTGRDYVPI